jgi:hypothetical protein
VTGDAPVVETTSSTIAGRCLQGLGLGSGGTDNRPDLIPGGDNNPILGGPDHCFDETQFTPRGSCGSRCRQTALYRFRIDEGSAFSLSLVSRKLFKTSVLCDDQQERLFRIQAMPIVGNNICESNQ